jgi:hypothetical protein
MKAALAGCLHCFGLWEDLDVLEVGVLEVGGVFEAVAEEAVDGNVGCPDEGDGGGEGTMLDVAGEEESEGKSQGVGEVVGGRSDTWVDEVAEHEEVGREEEDGEEEPACVEMPVGEEGEDEEGGFFDAEEDGGAGEHEMFIRVLG